MAKFEKQLTDLHNIVDKLDSPSLDLDEAIKLYEKGVILVTKCQEELATAECKVRTLVANKGKEVD